MKTTAVCPKRSLHLAIAIRVAFQNEGECSGYDIDDASCTNRYFSIEHTERLWPRVEIEPQGDHPRVDTGAATIKFSDRDRVYL